MIRLINRLSASLALLLAGNAFVTSAAERDSLLTERHIATYGVAFYNLENLFDTINANGKFDLEFSPNGAREWNSEKYAIKLNNIANAIANMVTPTTPYGPAIIGVAEVENISVMQDLVNSAPLRHRSLAIVHHDSPDPRGIDVGMLYDPELFTVLSVNNHTLIVADNPDFRTRDQMCVTGLLGGDSLSVIINHWPSRVGGQEESEPMRLAAATLTRHIADSLWAINPIQGIIILGDLNDDPSNKSCTEIVGGTPDANGMAEHGFFNPWWRILEGGRGTLTYRGAWNLFDQILVSGTLLPGRGNLTYRSAEIMDIDFLKQADGRYAGMPWRTYAGGKFLAGYSDHFPTEVFLFKEIKEKP